MVTISGSLISASTPPAPAVLSSPGFNGLHQFGFNLMGTTGSNYLVQVSTNLGSAWTPLMTNPAPFVFTDMNTNSAPRRFYRAVTAP
jgi:hypothetical protein